jgi:hypothetical protein
MVVDRRSPGESNTVFGLDGRFFPTPNLNLHTWLALSETKGDGGDDMAFAGTLTYRTDRWGLYLRHISIGPEMEARAGYIQRTNLRRNQIVFRRSFRTTRVGVRRVDFFGWTNVMSGVEGGLQDWSVGPSATVNFESGASFTFIANLGENRPASGFRLADTLEVGSGIHNASVITASASSDPSRPVVVDFEFTGREFYGGSLRSGGGAFRWAPSPRMSLEGRFRRDRVSVPTGKFTADVVSVRGAFAFSTQAFLNLLIQFNSLHRDLSGSLRVNLIHRPGSDLFLVLSEARNNSSGSAWEVQGRGALLKLTYLWRL